MSGAPRPRRPHRLVLALALLLALPAARADDYVDRVNALYGTIPESQRSDLVLLPAMVGMKDPPASVNSVDRSMLLPAGASGWDAALSWAMEESQRSVLAALARATASSEPRSAMAFGQPYGQTAVVRGPGGVELVRAGLYTDLGDPPLLAAAQFNVLDALNGVACLVNVEATRLAAEGQPRAAMDVLVNWVYLCRQMIDRAMFTESRWGYTSMVWALERLRDVAYQDYRAATPALSAADLLAIIERLRADGVVSLSLAEFPRGDKLAVRQIIDLVYLPRNGVNPATFASTMAQLGTREHPLRLFAEASLWRSAEATQGDVFLAIDTVDRVYGDWETRWRLDPFDPQMKFPFALERAPTVLVAVVSVLQDQGVLFNDRLVLRSQIAGTRTALAHVAYIRANRAFAPDVSAIRPRFVPAVDDDPFNSRRAAGAAPYFKYIVPNKYNSHVPGPRETPQPHMMNVVPEDGVNFQVPIHEDQFILYSVGPNDADDRAQAVSGRLAREAQGDLLIWPPEISLRRQTLIARGQLK